MVGLDRTFSDRRQGGGGQRNWSPDVDSEYLAPLHFGATMVPGTTALWCHYGTWHHCTLVPLWYLAPLHFGATMVHGTTALWCHYGTWHYCTLVPLWYLALLHFGATMVPGPTALWCHYGTW